MLLLFKKIFSNIAIALIYLLLFMCFVLVVLFSPFLWIKYRLLPYKKRQIDIELIIKAVPISISVRSAFEVLSGTVKIYRIADKKDTLPSIFYISKNDFNKIKEHTTTRKGEITVLATLEVPYWKYGFGKSQLISYKLLNKRPQIRK